MPTIKEIAMQCGVSVATVSNIINHKGKVSEETRRMVEKVIEETNFTPNVVARNLKTRNTRSIGVIAEDMTIFSMPDIIDGITEYCEKENYQILLVNLRLYKKYEDSYYEKHLHKELIRSEFQKLLSKQVEGIIYVAAHERMIRVIPEGIPIPVVVAYGFTGKKEIPSVVVRDTTGAQQMAEYLLSCGHRKIGIIAGKQESFHAQARLEGFQKALQSRQIPYDETLLRYGDWTRESGYQNTQPLLDAGVTAIFAMNDLMAGGVYDKLEELGLSVGKDIAVTGYDNREVASFIKPPLTTMALPLHDIGYRASEIIVKMLKKEDLEENGVYYVECTPYIRESVNRITES